jgi:hypothetical protein
MVSLISYGVASLIACTNVTGVPECGCSSNTPAIGAVDEITADPKHGEVMVSKPQFVLGTPAAVGSKRKDRLAEIFAV